jgi:hypothetical protein
MVGPCELEPRPLPCQFVLSSYFKNLQNRGDCQNTRKSHKVARSVGLVCGLEKQTLTGGGLLILPDPFAQTDFRLFCLH